jgi:hypothetical protein
MDAVPIPLDVEEITAEWLTAALGVAVDGVDVLDAHSGTTGRARLGLTYGGGAESGPASVFVKLAPFDPRQRKFVDMTGLGVAEARFYRDGAADVPVRVPVCHFSALDDDGRFVMVLEDLVASGCRFPGPGDADVADDVAAIVDALAHLHAPFWGDPRLDVDDGLGWVRHGNRVAFEHGGAYFARALELFGDEMGPTFRRLAELYVEKAPGIAQLLGAGPPTLIHGDPHLGNLFLDGKEAGFFDWGMLWRATGVRDVAYVLGNSTRVEVRRAHEREWLQHYVEVLASHGVELGFDEAWEQYRLLVIYAWSSATSTATMGSRWQTIEVGHGGMARATAAVEDLDSVPLLESMLA